LSPLPEARLLEAFGHLVPHALARVPSMRAHTAKHLPDCLAPSASEPHRGDAVPPPHHLLASRQPSSTSSSPHRTSLELASCHITQSPKLQHGCRSYRRRGPGHPRVSSHIPELFTVPPELVIHEPPPTPTSPEACLFKFPTSAASSSTQWSRRNAGATVSMSSTLPSMCDPSPSLPGAVVASLRQ
jgi:hypothetical protein